MKIIVAETIIILATPREKYLWDMIYTESPPWPGGGQGGGQSRDRTELDWTDTPGTWTNRSRQIMGKIMNNKLSPEVGGG